MGSARFYLCGLGIFPPYTASLEVIHALSLCDVIFNNVARDVAASRLSSMTKTRSGMFNRLPRSRLTVVE